MYDDYRLLRLDEFEKVAREYENRLKVSSMTKEMTNDCDDNVENNSITKNANNKNETFSTNEKTIKSYKIDENRGENIVRYNATNDIDETTATALDEIGLVILKDLVKLYNVSKNATNKDKINKIKRDVISVFNIDSDKDLIIENESHYQIQNYCESVKICIKDFTKLLGISLNNEDKLKMTQIHNDLVDLIGECRYRK